MPDGRPIQMTPGIDAAAAAAEAIDAKLDIEDEAQAEVVFE
jgi:hypothetical protein